MEEKELLKLKNKLKKICIDPYWSGFSDEDYEKEVKKFINLIFKRLPIDIIEEIISVSQFSGERALNIMLETGSLYSFLKNSKKVKISRYDKIKKLKSIDTEYVVGIFKGNPTIEQIHEIIGKIGEASADYIWGAKQSEKESMIIIAFD